MIVSEAAMLCLTGSRWFLHYVLPNVLLLRGDCSSACEIANGYSTSSDLI